MAKGVERPILDDVPWQRLRLSYGTAEKIPAAIARLTADDEETRRRAYWNLDNGVVCQSDLYEAAPYVVPFVLEIVERRNCPGNLLAYKLLYEIANGRAPDEVMSDYWMDTGPKRRMPLMEACRLAVLTGGDLYERDAREDSLVRKPAMELLNRMAEYSQEAADRVNRLKGSEDRDVSSAMLQVVAENA
jgi:hypothetical protein